MAYIGVQPTDTYLSIASQQITGTGSATYTLNYSVSTEEDVAVFVNNVRQNVSSYTVSGDQLTLGGTISVSDECWVLFLGRTVGTKTPAVGSVTNDMLAGSIANAKLANSSVTVNGTSIALGASGNISAGITEADQWRLTANKTASGNVTANLERNDTTGFNYIGTGMTESSGVFSFPSTGIYLITVNVHAGSAADRLDMLITQNNGASFTTALETNRDLREQKFYFDVTDTSTHKLKFDYVHTDKLVGDTNLNKTHFTFIRLGDT